MAKHNEYPDMVMGLPEIDVKLAGVRGWLLQAGDKQAVFFDIEPIGEIPVHTHSAQFGVVLEGEMSLTVRGETRRYKKGDSYFIPSGAPHSAIFHTRVHVIDFFDEPSRYLPRPTPAIT